MSYSGTRYRLPVTSFQWNEINSIKYALGPLIVFVKESTTFCSNKSRRKKSPRKQTPRRLLKYRCWTYSAIRRGWKSRVSGPQTPHNCAFQTNNVVSSYLAIWVFKSTVLQWHIRHSSTNQTIPAGELLCGEFPSLSVRINFPGCFYLDSSDIDPPVTVQSMV